MADKASNARRVIVTRGSKHEALATEPDLCFVPGESSPRPFPNRVGSDRLRNATQRTRIGGEPVFTASGQLGPPSEREHAGTDGGVHSRTYLAEARPVSYSQDVFCEGCAVVRSDDAVTLNDDRGIARMDAWLLEIRDGALALVRHPPRTRVMDLFHAALSTEDGRWTVTSFEHERLFLG